MFLTDLHKISTSAVSSLDICNILANDMIDQCPYLLIKADILHFHGLDMLPLVAACLFHPFFFFSKFNTSLEISLI